MRTIKWSYVMLRTLREMLIRTTRARIAAAIGIGVQVCGGEKQPNSRTERNVTSDAKEAGES